MGRDGGDGVHGPLLPPTVRHQRSRSCRPTIFDAIVAVVGQPRLVKDVNCLAPPPPCIPDQAKRSRLTVVARTLGWFVRYVPSDSTYGYVDVSNTTYTATGLTTGLQYYLRVSARNTIGYSGFCEFEGNTCSGTEASTTII